MSEIPPFAINQRVVYIGISNHVYKKNKKYTVAANGKCKKCGEWHSSTNETPAPVSFIEHNIPLTCTFCDGIVDIVTDNYGTDSKSFAPIAENFQAISYEKIMEEEGKYIGVN